MSASFDLDQSLTFDFDDSQADSTWNSPRISVETLVAGLPRVCVSSGECMICMEEFAGEARQMPCSHMYHSNCISRFQQKRLNTAHGKHYTQQLLVCNGNTHLASTHLGKWSEHFIRLDKMYACPADSFEIFA